MSAFSEQPWVDAACGARLAAVTPRLEQLLSPFGLRLIFLGGSASLGEAVGWEGSTRFVLSDLDLGVVTERPLSPPVAAEIAALSTANGAFPQITVGSYLAAQQHQQEPTLGLWDAVERGRVLAGDSRWLARFRPAFPSRIPAWEAYRLLGNRSLELLQAPDPADGEVARARALFGLGKLASALWTARLVLTGQYVTGRRDRLRLLEASAGDSALRSVALGWAPFLSHPGPETAPPFEGAWAGVRRGLVTFFREHGYWADAPNPEGPEDAFLAPRVRVRAWLRAWRREGQILVRRGAWKVTLRGTPESRRLGLALLYWVCGPEQPEPLWGPGEFEAQPDRWVRGSAKLTGKSLPPGPGCRERTLQWIRESARSIG